MYGAWGLAILLAAAQQAPATPPSPPSIDRTTMSGSAVFTYYNLKGYILKSAEKMPPDQHGFQPTPEVRSFAQILAHIADANYLLCSPALGEPNQNGGVVDAIEKQKLALEPLMTKLKDSFTYCDRAYGALSDANAADLVPFLTSKRPRVALHWFHISHAFEHYGNLVTYMRLKGIVPPSSDR